MSDRTAEPSALGAVRSLSGVAAHVDLSVPVESDDSLLKNDTLSDQGIDDMAHGQDERDDNVDIDHLANDE
jgi:hypothetical protein